MARWAFDILGIEVTKDKRAIKRAYAALVKKYHPEEQPTEWARAHEAYEAAMKYAQSDDMTIPAQRSNSLSDDIQAEQPKQTEEAVSRNEEYGDMFREAQSEWSQEKAGHEKELEHRMYELMRNKTKSAYEEWDKFFQTEFSPDESIDSMRILLDIVRAHPLAPSVVLLIRENMLKRSQNYQSSNEPDKAAVAAEIVKCAEAQIPKSNTVPTYTGNVGRRPKKTIPRLLIPMFGALIAVLTLIGGISARRSTSLEREAIAQAALYLNQKYEDMNYTEDDLEADSVYLSSEEKKNLSAYWITEKESYDTIAYVLSEKEKLGSVFVCFDNLQEKEIRKAFQEKVNSLTGYEEGKLFWNSASSYSAGKMENGYFQTKFDGDFDTFIENESIVRESAPGRSRRTAYNSSTAKNGNCDYYIPDPVIETLEERFSMQDITKDEELQTVLEQCAEAYGIQMRGVMLPKKYFEGKMAAAEANDNHMWVSEEIHGSFSMYPSNPLLVMTGWYVGIPSEDAENLGTKSGIYGSVPALMAEGIYGIETGINDYTLSQLNGNLAGSMQKAEAPASLELTDSQKQKSVSFQMTDMKELSDACCIAIEKSLYGIADSGYRVMLTVDGEETRELEVYPYNSRYAGIGYSEAMDGEGYLFVEYPYFWEEEEPPVITIVNR